MLNLSSITTSVIINDTSNKQSIKDSSFDYTHINYEET